MFIVLRLSRILCYVMLEGNYFCKYVYSLEVSQQEGMILKCICCNEISAQVGHVKSKVQIQCLIFLTLKWLHLSPYKLHFTLTSRTLCTVVINMHASLTKQYVYNFICSSNSGISFSIFSCFIFCISAIIWACSILLFRIPRWEFSSS